MSVGEGYNVTDVRGSVHTKNKLYEEVFFSRETKHISIIQQSVFFVVSGFLLVMLQIVTSSSELMPQIKQLNTEKQRKF